MLCPVDQFSRRDAKGCNKPEVNFHSPNRAEIFIGGGIEKGPLALSHEPFIEYVKTTTLCFYSCLARQRARAECRRT